MNARHPRKCRKRLPRLWLMTDARFGEELIAAIRRLPPTSGVIFRHYHLAEAERRRLFGQVRRVCRQRGHCLILAGDEGKALRWHADGFHAREKKARSRLIRTAPVHSLSELREAARNKADLVLISPLFPTQSHPDSPTLGTLAFNRLAKLARPAHALALGGMTRPKAHSLQKLAYGWAAIDAFRKKPR